MMKKIFLILFSFLFMQAFSQPNWKVEYSAYQYNMTITGIVCLEYINSADSNDMVGAFAGEECRGVASPVLNSSDSTYYVDLVVYSNENDKQITFKVYSAKSKQTVDIEKKIDFEINKIIGSQAKPYYWSSPTLSSEAIFNSYSIPGQIGETQISDSTISMHFSADFLPGNLAPTFEVPQRTKVFVNNTAQVSGETKNNFTVPLVYTLISADGTDTAQWRIIAIKDEKPELNATNTITPNGDGINDYWIINNPELFADYELKIVTSGGLQVFSTSNYQNDWNGIYKGKTLLSGAYHYILKKGSQVFSGTISLIK